MRRPGGAGFRRRSAGGPGCDPVRPAGRWGSGLTHGRAPGVCRAGRGAGRRRAGGGERAGGRLPCAGREHRRGRGEPGSAVPEKAPAGRSGAFPREAPQQSGWSGSEVLGREGPLTACFPSRERETERVSQESSWWRVVLRRLPAWRARRRLVEECGSVSVNETPQTVAGDLLDRCVCP